MTNKLIAQLKDKSNFDFVKIYCQLDDVIKSLELADKSKIGRPSTLNETDIAVISLLKSRYGISSLKQMYLLLQDMFSNYFTLPAYQNFVLAMNRFSYILLMVVNYLLSLNRDNCHPIKFIDSTTIPVCTNLNISSYKVMKGYSTISKSTTGWWYGLKLHTVMDYNNKPLLFALTSAKVGDRKLLKPIFKLFSPSIFVTDKGYLSKEKEQLAWQYGHVLLTGKRKSKHQSTLASSFDIHLLHERARIEVVFSVLKERLGLVNTLPRSVLGYLSHYIHVLFGYLVGKVVS